MEKVRVAAVGLGGRGQSVLDGLLLGMDTLRVTVVCDLYEDRVACGAASVERAYGERPFATTDWHAALDSERVDAVLIMSAWESHFPIAYEALEKGIAVGMEVGGAYTVEDCWRLVRTQERTGTPFMLLEKAAQAEVSEVFERNGLKPRVHFTTWDDYAIMSMVENGLGLSILPGLILTRCPYRIEKRPLDPPARRELAAVYRPGLLSSAARAFLDCLLDGASAGGGTASAE